MFAYESVNDTATGRESGGYIMRKQLLCSVAAIAIMTAISGPVKAADMPVKGRAVAVAPAYPDWSGFYLGGHMGYGWANFQGQDPFNDYLAIPKNVKPSGMALGLHTGYNWQSGSWVYGVEGDVTVTRGYDKKRCINECDSGISGTLHGLASLRARLGWTFDRTLIYATGGVAWAARQVQFNTSLLRESADGRPNKNKVGAVVGGGIEWKYSPNFSLRLEGLHYMFHEKCASCTGGTDPSDFRFTAGIRDATVIRVGASWHLDGSGGGWGKGPVASRY